MGSQMNCTAHSILDPRMVADKLRNRILIMRKSPGSAGGLPKSDVSVMGADEQSLDWAFMPERRRRGIFVEHGMIKCERRRCGIIPGLKRTNMSLPTELGLKGSYDYKDATPTALPEGLGGAVSCSSSAGCR